jgi:transcriptional regulator with XRE-family HTH domain
MTHGPLTPTKVIAARVRELRRKRGWTAVQLGEAMSAQGIRWDRSIVANLENGRRATVSVDEWFALAYVLDVPPIGLLVPADLVAEYMVTPTYAVGVGRVEPWVTGSLPLPPIDAHQYGEDRGRARWKPDWEERLAYMRAVYPELDDGVVRFLAGRDTFATPLERDQFPAPGTESTYAPGGVAPSTESEQREGKS